MAPEVMRGHGYGTEVRGPASEIVSKGGYKLMLEKHVGLNRCLFFQKFVSSLSYYVCICHVCSMLFFVISDVLQGNLWQ